MGKITRSQEKAEQIWKEYENGRAYQSSLGLDRVVPLCVDFYEGRQWGKIKKGTENFPRPVVNFIKMIVDNKRANLMSSPLRLVYKSDKPTDLTEKFNHFAEFWQKEAQIKYLDSEAIKAGCIKGTFIYHYYWDNEAMGKRGKIDGALRCQLIDVRNVVFANPQEKDEQKQEWIIIASRATVKSVRDKVHKRLQDYIVPDNETNDYDGQIDQNGTEMLTVLTKYYRKDGEVYFVKATKQVVLTEEMSLAPDYAKAHKAVEEKLKKAEMPKEEPTETESVDNKEIDSTNQTPDVPEEKKTEKYKAIYFPLVVGSYEEREGSIYGIGEVSGLINNQKTVNNILALQAYATENNAFGKIVVKGDALGDQTIDNKPGQIIYDYSRVNSQGIYRLNDPQMSEMPLNEIETIMSLSRSVTGSTEVMSGEVLGRNMSGQAIAQLQSQALLPTEEKRQRLQDVKLKQGRIMEMFFRTHYDEDREFTYTDSVYNAEKNKTEDVVKSDTFNATNYTEEIFDIVVEVTAGTRSSVSGDIAMLDLALQTKSIDFIRYLKLYPSDALSDKSKLLEELENSQKDENTQLKAINAQQEEQIKKLAGVVAKQDEVVQKAIQCIKSFETMQQLAIKQNAEFSQKIQMANKHIKEQDGVIQQSETEKQKLFKDSGDMFNKLWGYMSETERAQALAEMQAQNVNKA